MNCHYCGTETERVNGIWNCPNCGYNGLTRKEMTAEEWGAFIDTSTSMSCLYRSDKTINGLENNEPTDE